MIYKTYLGAKREYDAATEAWQKASRRVLEATEALAAASNSVHQQEKEERRRDTFEP